MKAFDYVSPRSLDEAVAHLAASTRDGDARLLAGGTDLLTLMKADLAAPERLIDIKRLAELDDRIADGPDGLTIGALATLAEIEDDPLVRAVAPALGEASGLAATPQLRNMATIGGNLLQRPRCWYFRNPRIPCWLKGVRTTRRGRGKINCTRCSTSAPASRSVPPIRPWRSSPSTPSFAFAARRASENCR